MKSLNDLEKYLILSGQGKYAMAINKSYRRAGPERHRDLPIVSTVICFRKRGGNYEVLLERRKKDPLSRIWALPGGHVQRHDDNELEDFATAGARELYEETAIKVKPADLLFVGCRPRKIGKEKLDMAFMVVLNGEYAGNSTRAGSDADEVRWTPVDKVPDLVFDHNYFLEIAVRQLQQVAPQHIDITGIHPDLSTGRGLLIVFEGIDGAGKSSQVERLVKLLHSCDIKPLVSGWASSALMKNTIKEAKKEHLPPEMYSLLHITDMCERYYGEITDALANDQVVILDRYLYTSLARDTVRGISADVILGAYRGFRKPNLVIHCHCPPDVTVERLRRKGGKGFGYYGSGQDLHFDSDAIENLRYYQTQVDRVYCDILPQVGAVKVDASRSIDRVARDIAKLVLKLIK